MKLTSEQVQERRKIVWQMRESGMTLAAIGKKIKRSKETVRIILARHIRSEREHHERQAALQGLTVSELMGRSILDLDLPTRAKTFFYYEKRHDRHDHTVADVMEMSDAELLRVPNFGKKTIVEMRSVIAKTLADAERVESNVH